MRRIIAASIALASIISSLLAANPAEEDCFRNKINQERTSRGIPALTTDTLLTTLARQQADRMAEAQTIYHNDNLGSEAKGFRYVGENVGMGPSCASIHDAFMASQGHRENILDTDYTRIGVGVEVRPNPGGSTGVTIYVAEVFGSTPLASKPAPPSTPPKPKPTCTCPK